MQNFATATGTNSQFNPIQSALITNQPLSNVTDLVNFAVNQLMYITIDNGSVLSTHLFGMIPDATQNFTNVICSPFNGYSFAFYMFFLFAFFSPILLLGGYGWMFSRADKKGVACSKQQVYTEDSFQQDLMPYAPV